MIHIVSMSTTWKFFFGNNAIFTIFLCIPFFCLLATLNFQLVLIFKLTSPIVTLKGWRNQNKNEECRYYE